jgi:vancomycin permeability regulator SanA
MKRYSKLLSYLFLSWFLIHSVLITVDGLWDDTSENAIVVILGNKVNEDGSLSDRLKSRVDKGLELYTKGIANQIIVSGGLGLEGHLEGNVMAKYLVEKGVPISAIIIDNKGNNTQATADNVKDLNLSNLSIIVVSQFYHISRTKLAFRQVGFKDIKGVHANYFEFRDFYSIFREFFGYYKYLIF